MVVPRSKAMRVPARRGVAGLDVDQHVVDDHRGHLEVGLRAAPSAAAAAACRSARSSRSSIAASSRSRSVRWSSRVGSVELDVPLLHGRPQDHLPADADGGGLGPGGQRRYVDLEVARRLDQAGQPPAGAQLVGAERAHVAARTTGTCRPTTRTLHFLQVPWPPQVESMAMPFQLAASKTLTPGGTRTSGRPAGTAGPRPGRTPSPRPVPSSAARLGAPSE